MGSVSVVVALLALAVLVVASRTRWTIVLTLNGALPPTLELREENRQGSVFGVSDSNSNPFDDDELSFLNGQFTSLDNTGDLNVDFDRIETANATSGFQLVLNGETNGTNPLDLFQTLRNVTIRFQNQSWVFDINNDDDDDTPILVTPRQDDNDDVPLILGIVFGILGGLLIIALVVMLVKRAKEQNKTGDAGTELETVRSLRAVSRSKADEQLRQQQQQQQQEPQQQEEDNKPMTSTEEVEPLVAEDEPTKPADVALLNTSADAESETDEPQNEDTNGNDDDVVVEQQPEDEPVQQQQQEEDEEDAPEHEDDDVPQGMARNPDSIAHKRASYRWNAAANEVADPTPGGKVATPSMERVMDDVHKQQNS